MATITLRAPLKDLAGGSSEIQVPGTTVGEALRALEDGHTKLTGWILDERGRIRRHVNVFVNGEKAGEDVVLAPGDRMHVLPSISGG